LVTQSGSRWLLKQVRGLTVRGWQGAVLTEWRAEQLQGQHDELVVQLNDAHMQVRPSCLLRSTLCLHVLEVARVELTLPAVQPVDEPSATLELPSRGRPFALEIQRVRVGEFILNGESLLSDAGLQAKWQSGVIEIGELALNYQDYGLQAKGQITAN